MKSNVKDWIEKHIQLKKFKTKQIIIKFYRLKYQRKIKLKK